MKLKIKIKTLSDTKKKKIIGKNFYSVNNNIYDVMNFKHYKYNLLVYTKKNNFHSIIKLYYKKSKVTSNESSYFINPLFYTVFCTNSYEELKKIIYTVRRFNKKIIYFNSRRVDAYYVSKAELF